MHCPETTSESSLQKNLVYAYNKVKNSNNSTYILVCTFQKKIIHQKLMSLCILQIKKSLSYHKKTSFWTKMRKKVQLFRAVLCSFCEDVHHQKWDVASTYMAPTSWQVVKDYIIPLAVQVQLCARHPVNASTWKYPTLLYIRQCTM